LNPVAFRATLLNVAGNTALFGLTLVAGILSGSIALISEAFNSLNDIAASLATFVCVKISDKKADEGHPFGHSRAEPIAGIIIAVLAGILGFEVIRASAVRLLSADAVRIGPFALVVPIVTMAVKGLMALHFRKVARIVNSPALNATAMDSFMDVFVALAALAGIAGAWYGYPRLDPLAGLAISLWIIYTGYRIGMENIAYLMGTAPEPAMMDGIRRAALGAPGVRGIGAVRAHYVGNFIHVEIHVQVDRDLPTYDSHAICTEVEKGIEAMPSIDKAFVHIDPV
jgi:cation diffusion facilitator family transporter